VATGRSSGAAEASSPFSSSVSRSVLDEASRKAGLDAGDAELLRLGENAIYRLARTPIVVRIGRRMAYWDDAAKEVAVARWLIDLGRVLASGVGDLQHGRHRVVLDGAVNAGSSSSASPDTTDPGRRPQRPDPFCR
jgi:hypothetical protein